MSRKGGAIQTRVMTGPDMSFTSGGLEPACWSTASQIRSIFKAAFGRANIPYFNPHSFRDTLTILGEQICQTPEEFKAWSQNLGHDSPLTTFTSYGKVPLHRQGELIREAIQKDSRDEKLDRLMEMMGRMQTEKTA